jgi:hypothetical protein
MARRCPRSWSLHRTAVPLVDDLSDAPLISPLRASLVDQKIVKSASSATITANKVDLSTKTGWYVDLPEAGERIVTHPAIVLGVLQFTSNIPDGSDPCLPGGRSWSYGVDYATGGAITKPMDPSIPWAKFLGQALASRIVLIKLPSGKVLGIHTWSAYWWHWTSHRIHRVYRCCRDIDRCRRRSCANDSPPRARARW